MTLSELSAKLDEYSAKYEANEYVNPYTVEELFDVINHLVEVGELSYDEVYLKYEDKIYDLVCGFMEF